MQFLVGVDEVGRGPLAGPVAVGVTVVPQGFDWERELPGVTDSKKLPPENRAAIFRHAQVLRRYRKLDFTVAQVGPSSVDRYGINYAVTIAIERSFARLKLDSHDVSVRLDGLLYAPAEYQQATIVKGDLLWPEIGLASIVAKVTRDTYMERIARRYTQYDFEAHKGYGTKAHREAIATYGICPIHRQTYCKNIISL